MLFSIRTISIIGPDLKNHLDDHYYLRCVLYDALMAVCILGTSLVLAVFRETNRSLVRGTLGCFLWCVLAEQLILFALVLYDYVQYKFFDSMMSSLCFLVSAIILFTAQIRYG